MRQLDGNIALVINDQSLVGVRTARNDLSTRILIGFPSMGDVDSGRVVRRSELEADLAGQILVLNLFSSAAIDGEHRRHIIGKGAVVVGCASISTVQREHDRVVIAGGDLAIRNQLGNDRFSINVGRVDLNALGGDDGFGVADRNLDLRLGSRSSIALRVGAGHFVVGFDFGLDCLIGFVRDRCNSDIGKLADLP